MSGRPGLRSRLADAVRDGDHTDAPPGALLRFFARAEADSGAARLRLAALEEAAARALRAAGMVGIVPIPLGDPRYPPHLAAIVDPPVVLWTAGIEATLTRPAVAIVGSRAASPYALEMAERLAADLAARGVVVVSGLARGVDSAAHRGALETGDTLAVLGSGVDIIYPPEHDALAGAIRRRGGLVSEFPPGTPPRAYHFPLRNRIISGLSLALVVIEASDKSGSLITASCALEQGREVMAVPGNVLTGRNRGAHALLRDGAKIVETADDILEELPGVGRLTNRAAPGTRLTAKEAGPATDIDPFLACLLPGEPCSVDELAGRTGLDTGRILARLAELELDGIVRRVGGGRYVRSGRTC